MHDQLRLEPLLVEDQETHLAHQPEAQELGEQEVTEFTQRMLRKYGDANDGLGAAVRAKMAGTLIDEETVVEQSTAVPKAHYRKSSARPRSPRAPTARMVRQADIADAASMHKPRD